MSEPMPGAAPAQQDGDPEDAVGDAEPVARAEPAEPGLPEPGSGPPWASAPERLAGEEKAEQDGTGGPEQATQPERADAGPDAAASGRADAGPETAQGTAPGEPEQETAPGGPEPEDDGPRPLGLHVEPTGHAPVDAQLRRLDDADHLAVSGHLEVYEDVHRGLREALSGLDRQTPAAGAPAPTAPGAPSAHAAPSAPGPSAHGPGRPVPGPPYHRS